MGVLIMSGRILERSLIEYGAPTLAGLKTASLFCVPMLDDWQSQVNWWNDFLHEKGLSLQGLRCQEGRVLLYLYRPAQLQRDIQQPGVKEFLAGYGYGEFGTTEAVARLPRDRYLSGVSSRGCGGLHPQWGQKLQMLRLLESLLQ